MNLFVRLAAEQNSDLGDRVERDLMCSDPVGHTDLFSRFAAASSDFAHRQPRDGELPAGSRLTVAVRHLLCVLDLVPDRHRTSFLFLYWEQWTRRMSPAQRVELGAQADRVAGTIPAMATGPVDEPARLYRLALRAIAADQHPADPAPLTYLLFELAHLGFDELRIPLSTRVIAARAVRTAIVSGLDVPTLFSSASELQSA